MKNAEESFAFAILVLLALKVLQNDKDSNLSLNYQKNVLYVT